MKTCPHCDFQSDPTVTKCPKCGIIFEKWEAIQAREQVENRIEKTVRKMNKVVKEEKDKGQRLFTIKIPLSRILGIATIVLGAIGLFYTLSMETYVSTESFGRVHNICLLSKQRNYVIICVFLLLIGTIALVFSFIKKRNDEIKECPECAESVGSKAKKCRFCGHIFND